VKIWSDLKIKNGIWSYGLKDSKSQAIGNGIKIKAHVAVLIKIKRKEVTAFIIMQAQVEKEFLYLIFRSIKRSAIWIASKSQC
jgi:hypothetical protein